MEGSDKNRSSSHCVASIYGTAQGHHRRRGLRHGPQDHEAADLRAPPYAFWGGLPIRAISAHPPRRSSRGRTKSRSLGLATRLPRQDVGTLSPPTTWPEGSRFSGLVLSHSVDRRPHGICHHDGCSRRFQHSRPLNSSVFQQKISTQYLPNIPKSHVGQADQRCFPPQAGYIRSCPELRAFARPAVAADFPCAV